MNLAARPHYPLELPLPGGVSVVVPLPCLQCILDSWAIRALTAARMRVAGYRVGTTNWAPRPVNPTVAIRREAA